MRKIIIEIAFQDEIFANVPEGISIEAELENSAKELVDDITRDIGHAGVIVTHRIEIKPQEGGK